MAGKKTKPFAADDDDDKELEERANERDADKVKKAASEEEPEEFEVGGDDEDDDDEATEDDERPSRKARRRARYDDILRSERERREAAEATAAKHQELLERLALARTEPAPRQAEDPDKAEKEKLEQEAKDLRAAQQALVERHSALQGAKQLTPELDKQMQDEAWQIQDRLAANQIRRHSPRPQAQQQVTPQQMLAVSQQARLMQDHGDVVNHQRGAMAFRGLWMAKLAAGAPDNWDTVNSVMDEARRTVGLPPKGGRPAPTNGQKRKYGGVSRGGSGGGEPGEKIRMTDALKAMADAAYPHIKEPGKRYQYYVNKHGARLNRPPSRET